MLDQRALQQGQVEAIDVLGDLQEGLFGHDVERGVDRAEQEVEVDQDGLVLGRLGQVARDVDGQRGAAHPPRRPHEGDDVRAAVDRRRRLGVALEELIERLFQLLHLGREAQELAGTGPEELEDDRAFADRARREHDRTRLRLADRPDQGDGLLGARVGHHDRQVGPDLGDATVRPLVGRADLGEPDGLDLAEQPLQRLPRLVGRIHEYHANDFHHGVNPKVESFPSMGRSSRDETPAESEVCGPDGLGRTSPRGSRTFGPPAGGAPTWNRAGDTGPRYTDR